MRISITAVFLFLISSFTVAQTKFQVNGIIQNIPGVKDVLTDGDSVTLVFRSLNRSFTAQIKNNAFSIAGDIVEPAVSTLEFKGSGLKILIDSSIYDVKIINKQLKSNQYTYEGSVSTSSLFHNGWFDFVQSILKLYDQKTLAVNELEAATTAIAKEKANLKISSVDSLINANYKKLALSQPNNPAAAYLLGSAPDFSYANYIDIYNQLSFKVRNGFFGKALYDKLLLIRNLKTDKEVAVADIKKSVLPTINMIDTLGKNTLLNPDFFKQSKYTLIEFWASWCAPCRLINVDLRAKEQAYLDKGLRIVGFSLDQDAVAWRNAIVADQLKWANYSDLKATHSPLAKFLNLNQIPANLVVDDNGVIVARNVYGTDLEIIFTKTDR